MNYKSKLPVVVVIMIMLLSSASMVFGGEGVSEDNSTLANDEENDAGNLTEHPGVPDSTEDTDPSPPGNETDNGNANESVSVGNETDNGNANETVPADGETETETTSEADSGTIAIDYEEDNHAGFAVTHADELTNIQCGGEEDATADEHSDDKHGGGPPEGKGPGDKGKKGGHSASEESDSVQKGRYRHGHGHPV